MLRFKNYLSEEVLPAAQVKDGSIDLEKPAVRGQINATLASVTAQSAVTPYIVLHRISKALAYFHIIMPKRAYLEGDKGVEVVELKQFGHRMGMTNDGEFVHDVPGRYFLFLSYRVSSSIGGGYGFAADQLQSLGGSFKVTAKVVDEVELQSLLSAAEISLAENCDAYEKQQKYKAMAPKEPMKDIDSSTEGSKSAADSTMRKKDKKLSASSLDEDKDPCWKGYEMIGMKKKGGRKVPNCVPMKEEQIDEVSKSKAIATYRSRESQRRGEHNQGWGSEGQDPHDDYGERSGEKADKTLSRIHKKFGTKTAAQAKRGADIDSSGRSGRTGGSDYLATKQSVYSKFSKPKTKKGTKERKEYMSMNKGRFAKEETIEEAGMPASVIKHKQKLASMTPDELKQKFAGKTEQELKSMARRHGYGKDSDVYSKHIKEDSATTTGQKKLRVQHKTVVKKALGRDEPTKTILVTRKGDPHAAAGGGVRRIPKDKYDPSKYNLASE